MKITLPFGSYKTGDIGGLEIEIKEPEIKSPIKMKPWYKRIFCKHNWILYHREKMYFYQEHIGSVTYHACNKCGETKTEESDW